MFRINNLRRRKILLLVVVSIAVIWSSFCNQSRSIAAGRVPIRNLQLHDTDGDPIVLGEARWTVFCFLGTECPLARLYGARLQQLASKFASSDVRFIGINSNIQDSPADIDAFAKAHQIQFPIAKDASQVALASFDAKRTPEIFVCDAAFQIRYRGRVDDQYQPGVARAEPTVHDLRDALESLIAGRPVNHTETPGVGCLITRINTAKQDEAKPDLTFHRDIVPILNQHCVECHRDSEIGPFSLTQYEEVVGWGQMMIEVIEQKRMPPWHADESIGHFAGQRRVSDKELNLIRRWVDQGMTEGDPGDAPEPPNWNSGWHLATDPDVELTMRRQPFEVPAEGIVEYQYFVVDPGWDEDRWIRAAQVLPGNASVVHHAIVFVRPPDGSAFHGIGWMGAYVPGQRTAALPSNHARYVPAGSKLVFQMHYTPNGQTAKDLTKVGVWFADHRDVTHCVMTHVLLNHEFEIPPGESDYQVTMRDDSFAKDGRLLGLTPHMHFRGKSFRAVAVSNDGTENPLLHVPRYDFNWQHWYQFENAIDLSSIDSLKMEVTFDNSKQNPFNPDPAEYVSWGDQTWEEMAVAFFDVAVPGKQPQHHYVKQAAGTDPQAMAARDQMIQKRINQFIADMDTDGDQVILKEETPVAFQRFGFWRIDRNRDNRIDATEVRQHVQSRY